jgi:monoamine oxidase
MPMERSISRRGFLAALSAAAGVAALGGCGAGAGSRKERVIVVGAGLAGLAAAYELIQAGVEVLVLEATSRPGGRVLTLRAPFADGLFAEAGPMHVPDHHDATLRYIDAFNIHLDEGRARAPATHRNVFVGGRLVKVAPWDGGDWQLPLRSDERNLSLAELHHRYVRPLVEGVGDPLAPGWPGPEVGRLDRITFAELIRQRGASDAALSLLRLGYFDVWGDGIDSYSALFILRDLALKPSWGTSYRIRGGSDVLPHAFARALEGRIRFSAPVVEIRQTSRHVVVMTRDNGLTATEQADRLVCAIPFSVLRRIRVTPNLSEGKRLAIHTLSHTSIARVFLQCRSRFWLKSGLGDDVATDLPIMNVRDAALDQPGARGILESFSAGPAARRITAIPPRSRIEWVTAQIGMMAPEILGQVESGVSKCWDEDPWARGDYAWFRPGEMTTLLPHIAPPEGRIHFAGDHTSSWPGWMQGALESGMRAAREVITAG